MTCKLVTLPRPQPILADALTANAEKLIQIGIELLNQNKVAWADKLSDAARLINNVAEEMRK